MSLSLRAFLMFSHASSQFCKVWTTVQSYLTIASFMSIHGENHPSLLCSCVTEPLRSNCRMETIRFTRRAGVGT